MSAKSPALETFPTKPVQGLTLDWLPINESWGCAGCTMQEAGLRLRQDTGVSIVAVVRDAQTIPTPPLDFRLLAGDTVVVVGTPQSIREAAAALQTGPTAGPAGGG